MTVSNIATRYALAFVDGALVNDRNLRTVFATLAEAEGCRAAMNNPENFIIMAIIHVG